MVDISDLKRQLNSYDHNLLIGEKEASKAAVLIPLVEKDDGYSVLFEERALHLKSQPGDICFPGGKIERGDTSPQYAAARETCEELGIELSSIEIIGSLGRYVPSTHLIVYPFVGILNPKTFQINKDEVESIFTVPLDYLIKTEPEKHFVQLEPNPNQNFPFDRIAKGKEYQWRKRQITELFYHYGERSIWGMTARILNHFLSIIKPSS
ncbi:MAG TPA: CoA pyrophosphatase [Sporolactobacillaceae bacterium]|nr:CoA pyrophosphatase [Sporolactobacillaceae bacterium]